jgi:hypothetical protein
MSVPQNIENALNECGMERENSVKPNPKIMATEGG